MANKKEVFKLLIKHFHESTPPAVIKRDLHLPSSCLAVSSKALAAPLPDSYRPSIIVITGPRRCGKTYLIHQLIDHFCSHSTSPVCRTRIIYINFEDDRLLPVTLSDLGELWDAYFELYPDNRDEEIFIFFDEIHHVEGWELFLQRLLDQEKVRLFISSSSSKSGTRSQSSSLSCRTLELAISPLSFKEFLVFKGLDVTPDLAYSKARFKAINLLDEYLAYGGYPEVVLSEPSRKIGILKNYYEIFVYRDLVEHFAVRNIGLLKSLLKHLMTSIGSSFSVNAYFLDACRDLHISRETVIEYVSFLERRGLISLVPIYSESSKVRQVNPRKAYSLDNGIRNAVTFPLPQQEEKLARNLVFQELLRAGDKVTYWRSKQEVDFIARNGRLRAINVCYGSEPGDGPKNSLQEFWHSANGPEPEMTVITKDTEKTEGEIKFCPLWKWLLTSDGTPAASSSGTSDQLLKNERRAEKG